MEDEFKDTTLRGRRSIFVRQQEPVANHVELSPAFYRKLLRAPHRHAWFDVPFMLVMLALGAFAVSDNPTNSEVLLGRTALFFFYTLVLLVNIYSWATRARGVSTFLDAPVWEHRSPLILLNVTADITFAGGVLLLYARGGEVVVPFLLALASIRLVEQLAGRLTPIIVLTAALAGTLFNTNYLLAPDRDDLLPLQGIEVLAVVVSFLMLSYTIWLRGRSQEVDITRILEAARIEAEHAADVLSAQVLRRDLLQSGLRAVNSAIELDELLMMIVNNAVRVLKAEQSTIGLIDEKTGNLVVRCATGIDSSELKGRYFLPGAGVAGWVTQHGVPALINDVFTDPRYVSLGNSPLTGRSTRSMLCVPLIIEQKVIGALSVTHSMPDVLTEDDQGLITSFAEQAAMAVYKSQLLAQRTRQRNELRRRKELITSLNLVTRSVLSSLDLPEVLDTIIARMGELVTFDQAFIYLRNERTDELQLSALAGKDPCPASPELRGDSTVMKWWEQTPRSPMAHWHSDDMYILCLRLINGKDALGYILLARTESRPFKDEERRAARQLADAATIAIIKARLFSQVTSQQHQATALYRLMLSVNGAPDRKELAKVVCRELRQITGAKASALLMEDSEQARITVWATDGKWAAKEMSGVSLQAHGDLFLSSVLTALNKSEPLDLVLIQNTPQQLKEILGASEYVTIPLAGAGRIYGLLVMEPKSAPAINDEVKETVRLAVSHSTVALERAELLEARMRSMRQSNMLYSIATQVQESLESTSIVDTMLQGALRALPIHSCELYLLDESRTHLQKHSEALAQQAPDAQPPLGPKEVALDSNSALFEVLHSSSLMIADLDDKEDHSAGPQGLTAASAYLNRPVVLARLMSSEEALGVVRFTTSVPPEEFVRTCTTFCNTLLTHAGGALERSHLYAELIDSKRRLEAVVLSMSNGVIVVDSLLNVIISNSVAGCLLNVPGGMNNKRSLADLADDTGLLEMARRCIRYSQQESKDLNLTLDGEARTYEATVNPIMGAGNGDVFGAVLMLRDVTIPRANERAKSDFLSMISHELRTPLNSMYGFLDIALSGKTGPLTELQTDFLSTAKQETVVLKRLINDLLDYSRLQSRTLHMEMEPLDLSSLLARVIRSASARLAEDELTIKSDVPRGLVVIGDEVRLQQVFDNVLDNAAKFTDPGGEIVFSCRADGERITISISDTGCGIPPSQLDAIFDRFFQADNHSKRRKRGQGLGLAICKNIVEAHNGLIRVESSLGVGTTMYVEVPQITPAGGLLGGTLLVEDAELMETLAN